MFLLARRSYLRRADRLLHARSVSGGVMVVITKLIALRNTRGRGKHVSQSRMNLLRCKSGRMTDDRVGRQQGSQTGNCKDFSMVLSRKSCVMIILNIKIVLTSRKGVKTVVIN